jgi:hypothetical protein
VKDFPGLVGNHGLLDPEPFCTDRLPLRPLGRHATCTERPHGKQRQPLGKTYHFTVTTSTSTGVNARRRAGGGLGGGRGGVGGRGRRGRRPAAAALRGERRELGGREAARAGERTEPPQLPGAQGHRRRWRLRWRWVDPLDSGEYAIVVKGTSRCVSFLIMIPNVGFSRIG